MANSGITLKEKIIIAVLRDIYEQNHSEQAFDDMNIISFKMEGYEELVEHYAKQIAEILTGKGGSDVWYSWYCVSGRGGDHIPYLLGHRPMGYVCPY